MKNVIDILAYTALVIDAVGILAAVAIFFANRKVSRDFEKQNKVYNKTLTELFSEAEKNSAGMLNLIAHQKRYMEN